MNYEAENRLNSNHKCNFFVLMVPPQNLAHGERSASNQVLQKPTQEKEDLWLQVYNIKRLSKNYIAGKNKYFRIIGYLPDVLISCRTMPDALISKIVAFWNFGIELSLYNHFCGRQMLDYYLIFIVDKGFSVVLSE